MLETLEGRDLMSVTAVDDIAATVRNAPVEINVLANDVITDAPSFTISILPNTAKASLSVTTTNNILYTPNLNAIGPDTFSYTITPVEGESSTSFVSVTISKSASELYVDYQFLVAQADLAYFNTVQPALNDYQTAIDDSRTTSALDADAAYAQYLADRLLASDAYDLAHADVIATFHEAVLQAKMTENDRINAALAAYDSTTDGPGADLESAIDAAAAQYDAAALIINGDYDAAVVPFIAARDAALVIALADPSDAIAAAALASAESDLLNAETTYGDVRDAELANAAAVQASAEQAASDTYLPTLLGASAAFDAELNGANLQYLSDEEAAWVAAQSAEGAAQLAFTQVEQMAWDTYSAALASINTLQWGLEYSQLFQFQATANAALSAWQTAEADAWQQYLTGLALIPDAPAPGVRQANPAFAFTAPNFNASIIASLPRLELVLAAPDREEFFVVQPGVGPPAPNVLTELNISGSTDATFVRRAIASVDVRFRLADIPIETANAAAPAFVSISVDQSSWGALSTTGGGGAFVPRAPLVRAAQLARINLRVNLINIKQGLVNSIYNMVIANPPAGVVIVNANVEAMANQTADDLIRMTDLFLRTHPGARPELSSRPRIGLEIGDRFSAPWCADWAGAMSYWIRRVIQDQGAGHPANAYLEFSWGQSINFGLGLNEMQHNFVIIRPRGHAIQYSVPGNDAVDANILMLDSWRNLLPSVYSPTPWSVAARRTPTQEYVNPANRSSEYIFYETNRRDRRFDDPWLRLGGFFPPPGGPQPPP